MQTEELNEQIEKTKVENQGLEPYINKDYYCLTCGSHSGECHPITGYCFICNSDDWEPENINTII